MAEKLLKGFGKLHSRSQTATDVVVWSHWAVAVVAAAAGLVGIVPGDSLPPPSRIADPSGRVVVVCTKSLVCRWFRRLLLLSMIVFFSVPPSRKLACIQTPGRPKRDVYSVRITTKILNGVWEQQVAACLAFRD